MWCLNLFYFLHFFLQNHIPSLRDAPKRVSKEKIIKNAMEYIEELSNLLKKYDVFQRVHAGNSQDASSIGFSKFLHSNNFSPSGSVMNPKANSAATVANGNLEFHQLNNNAGSANSAFLLEYYLSKGNHNAIDNTSAPKNSELKSRSTIIQENEFSFQAPTLADENTSDICTENRHVCKTSSQFPQDLITSPVSRVPSSQRMNPRSLVNVFKISSYPNKVPPVDTCEPTPHSPPHSISSCSSSILSDEDIDQLFLDIQQTDFVDAMTDSDVSAPSSPSSPLSGVFSFASDDEELDFVLETACDIMSNEILL